MSRANKRTGRLKGRQVRNQIHSRRLAAAHKAEDAWEAEKARPLRELVKACTVGPEFPAVMKQIREIKQKHWPTRNKTKRGFAVYGITKSMLSRARRGRNDIVVAD